MGEGRAGVTESGLVGRSRGITKVMSQAPSRSSVQSSCVVGVERAAHLSPSRRVGNVWDL